MELLNERLVKRLKRLALRNPDLALRLAAGLGTALGPGSRWSPTPEEIALVLGERRPSAVRAIQRRIAANVLRSLALGAVANRRGLASLADRVDVVHGERLLALREQRTPLVAVLAHLGAGRGASAAFEKLGVPARIATLRPPPAVMGCVRSERVDDATRAARFLRRAAADLEKGVVPMVPFDGALAGTIPVSFLGRQLEVGRGLPFLAARGARLLPVTSRWVGNSGRIETTIHPPIPELGAQPSEDLEREFVEMIAAWFEGYVRRNPGELRLWKLRDLYAAKPARTDTLTPRDGVARGGAH